MLRPLKMLVWGAVVLIALGCSNSTEMAPSTPTTPVDPGTNSPVTPALPALLNQSVPIALRDFVNYSGLFDIASDFTPELVGDPLIGMELNLTAGQVSGSMLLSFEDQLGFWGAIINTFGSTGRIENNFVDLIFADDELVIRTVGTRSGNNFDGIVYYRVREAGDTACKPVTVYCDVTTDDSQEWWLYPSLDYPDYCSEPPNVDTACVAYMNTGLSEVKDLGAFSTTFSNWMK